jgi:hypothetical protein
MRIQILFITVFLLVSPCHLSAETNSYSPPRTAFGQPDIQGTWSAASFTMLERNPKFPGLIVPPPVAKQIVDTMRANFPDNIDPQFSWDNVQSLNQVRGEYRTSIIVQPEDGLIPYTPLGLQWAEWSNYRQEYGFDNPEQRPRPERCFGGFGIPPMQMFPVKLPRLFVQTSNHIVIYTEDTSGVRIISLSDSNLPAAIPSLKGQSTGQWQGNTLVVHTNNFQTGNDPTRFGLGRPILFGEKTAVTEKFTPVSEQELLYQYTVEDPDFYTQAWSGEFSLTRTRVKVYEYSCHEGNYSMAGMLRGNQLQQAAQTEPVAVVARPK